MEQFTPKERQREWDRRRLQERRDRIAAMPQIECACGCGTLIPPLRVQDMKPARFAQGHNQSSRNLGHRHTAGARAKMSAARRGEKNPRYIHNLAGRIAYIESHIDKPDGEDGCWRWRKYHSKAGRPITSLRGKNVTVYRALYEHYEGPVPDGLGLDHYRCDNGWCCNYHHVRPETNGENKRRDHEQRRRARPTCKHGHDRAIYGRRDAKGVFWCTKCNQLKYQRRKAGLTR